MIERKETRDTKPTEMQKKAFDKMVVNGGKKAQSLREVGYSPAVVNNPTKVTDSKGWKQLEEEHLPQEHIAETIKQGMDATKNGFEYKEVEDEDEDGNISTQVKKVPVKTEDWHARHKFVDTACKLRGMYPREPKGDVNINVFSLAELADKSTKRKQLGFVPVVENTIEKPDDNQLSTS